jgi:ribosomal protein S8E
MPSSNLSHIRKRIRLTGRDRKHLDVTHSFKSRKSDVGREPAIDTIAVKHDSVGDRHFRKKAWKRSLGFVDAESIGITFGISKLSEC